MEISLNSPTITQWHDFLLAQKHPPFFQSWQMRRYYNLLGQKAIVVAMREQNQLAGLTLAVVVRARRGSYLYLPYGPICTPTGWQALPQLTTYLKQIVQQEKVDFIRAIPFIPDTQYHRKLFQSCGWQPAPTHVLAEHLWILDITPSTEQILKGLRKTMRNLIRQAERKGVQIRFSNNPADLETFISIHQDTVARHKFTPYSNKEFRAQLRAFAANEQCQIFLAEYNGQAIAAAIIMFFGDTAHYHHGASLSEYNKIPASYLLQWHAIQEAKKRGLSYYNFWGIVPKETYVSPILRRKHPMTGLSNFKIGFGGAPLNLLHCQDFPLTTKYYLAKTIETVRRIKRGYYKYNQPLSKTALSDSPWHCQQTHDS